MDTVFHLFGGFLLISLPVVTIHLIAFSFSKKMNHILCSVVSGQFVFISALIVFGISGQFQYSPIILFLPVITGFLLRKFREKIPCSKIPSRSSIFFSFAFIVFLIGYEYCTCFSGQSTIGDFFHVENTMVDSYRFYLPWGRIIASENVIPASHLENNLSFIFPNLPLLYIQIAFLFEFGFQSVQSAFSLILFYSAFIVLFILNIDKRYCSSCALILFTNATFVRTSTGILQDVPLMFFSTIAFYSLFAFSKKNSKFSLILLAISCSLASLSKPSGIIISFLIFILVLPKAKINAFWFVLAFIPVSIWISRNYFLYGMPLPPFLGSLFNSPYSKYFESPMIWTSIEELRKKVLIHFFIILPTIVFSSLHIIRNIKDTSIQYFLFLFFSFAIFITFFAYPSSRYFLPFFGYLSYFAGVQFNNLRLKFKKEISVSVLVLIILVSSCPSQKGEWESLALFKEDKIVLGVASNILIWHGNLTVFEPESFVFRILNDGWFDYTQDANYYFELCKRLNIGYIFDNPKGDMPDVHYALLSKVLIKIDESPLFELIYDDYGIRIWRIL